MVKSRTTLNEDVDNAARLEEHARRIMATNQEHTQRSWYDPGVKWSIFSFAVVGMVVVLVLAAAALYPIAVVSLKYWGAM